VLPTFCHGLPDGTVPAGGYPMRRNDTARRAGTLIILSVLVAGCPTSTSTVPSIHFSNLHDSRRVESGFVVGTAASPGGAIVLVEAKVDGGAWEPASGAESWRYKLPTGVFAWKQGSSHTVTARARDAQGTFSTELTVTVVKGRNRDIDGDGYADLVAGAPLYDSWHGRAYVFRGGPSGIASRDAGSADAILTGEADSEFGYAVAVDDIDGNGYADVAVGAPASNGNQGRVYVFYGSSSGIASASAGSAYTILTGESGSFGISVNLGHVNGDGCADLAAGANGYGSNEGRAYLFHGTPSGISSRGAGAADTILTGDASSAFGFSVALGDVNGDGYDDVAVGAPNSSSGQGRAYVFRGSISGVTGTSTGDADTVLTGLTGESGAFAYALALGDANGDGCADVAAGAPYHGSSAGGAYVFLGSSSGIFDRNAADADTKISGEAGSVLGCAVAFGDADGDRCEDLSLGALFYGSELGRAYVFLGSASGISDASAAAADAILEGASGTTMDFGSSMGFVDVNGDGCADLAVGACCASMDIGSGSAYVFQGSAAGIPGLAADSADVTLTGENTNDCFAWALSP
jgi:hypothetical protein